jgi:hypothetical protein
VRKTCGIGLFYRNYRSLLEETGWLGCWLHQCVLRNMLAGSKPVVSIFPEPYWTCLALTAADKKARKMTVTPPSSSKSLIPRTTQPAGLGQQPLGPGRFRQLDLPSITAIKHSKSFSAYGSQHRTSPVSLSVARKPVNVKVYRGS